MNIEYDTHDAFTRRGLGLNGLRIWRLLRISEEPIRQCSIADEFGVHPNTVGNNLRRLRKAGLVGQVASRGPWYALERDLDEVATELGVSGALKRQRAQHARERDGFALAATFKKEQERKQQRRPHGQGQQEDYEER